VHAGLADSDRRLVGGSAATSHGQVPGVPHRPPQALTTMVDRAVRDELAPDVDAAVLVDTLVGRSITGCSSPGADQSRCRRRSRRAVLQGVTRR
jgi:hypothetical protein